MDLGLSQILKFKRDPGDRNRTSPFAFTGNRFEFRAVGSSQSVSGPLVAMNTMLADSLDWVAGKLEKALASGVDKTAAVILVLKELMETHGKVVFGGNGYSPDWHKEAVEKRGLRNLRTSAEAIPVFKEAAVVALFESTGVLTPKELASRFDVYAEQYVQSIEVEAKLVIDMATTRIYPAALDHICALAKAEASLDKTGFKLKDSGLSFAVTAANDMMSLVGQLKTALSKHDFPTVEDHLKFCATKICPLMLDIRKQADGLEAVVADEIWPLPKYFEMLNIK